jgi:hypothetical protein
MVRHLAILTLTHAALVAAVGAIVLFGWAGWLWLAG